MLNMPLYVNGVLACTVFCICFLVNRSFAYPMRERRGYIDDDVQRYLMRYNYIPMSNQETGNLRTETELREALRTMQRFGHIPQTGVVDEATIELMQRPRCSLPDIPIDSPTSRWKRYIKQGNVWKKLNLTWGIRSYPDHTRDNTGRPDLLSTWEIQKEIHLATKVWGDASRLAFTQLTDNADKSDIVIDFKRGYHGDGYPFDGPGRTLAHAFYPGSEDINGDMHFDAEEPWKRHQDSLAYEDVSLLTTAAHELGHALGLYHSDVEGALMSPYLVKFPQNFALPPDDTRGIQELYGANENQRIHDDQEEMSTETPTSLSPTHAPQTPPSTRPTLVTDQPNTCDTDYDAISVIRREIYIFKGEYFWRIDRKGKPLPNYPAKITAFWSLLPKNLTHIDAVYERYHDGNIVFFIGQRYYVCDGNEKLLETGPLRSFGLPDDLKKIDAVFVWGHNGMTYFFSDTMYWRFDESISKVELDYPRDMAMWRGVPYNIDSAFKYNGTTYFFKGKMFWAFDDLRMKISRRSPSLSAPYWFNCPNSIENQYYAESSEAVVNNSASGISKHHFLSLALAVLVSVFARTDLGVFKNVVLIRVT